MSLDTSINILVINQSESLRKQICQQLHQAQLTNTTECADGISAIQLLQESSFDMIITDIDIANIDAWRLTRLIRSDILKADAKTPIIIVSSTFSERIAEATSKEFEVHQFIPFSKLNTLPSAVKQLTSSENSIRKSRVLVIEDYKDTAQLVERILKNRFDISHAEDGESGLEAWIEGQHDIVLLDQMLPKMTGEQVLKEILKRKPSQSVVMMTAHGDAQKASEWVLEGAVDFISKPFKAEQLRHVCSIAAHREDFIISNEQFEEKQIALSAEKSRAHITLESIADGVITTDANGIINYANPIALKVLAYAEDEILEMSIKDVFQTYHEISRIPMANPVNRALSENRIINSNTKTMLRNKHHDELIIEQQAAPIRDSHSQITGAVLIFRDLTSAQNMEKQLTFHASHDPLTGLKNRDMFDQEMCLAMHEAKDGEIQHALCHLDVLQFKMVNDTCTFRGGDKLLQQVASVLKQKVRAPSDAVARTGDSEFGILLRHCPADAAERICENIITELSNQKFEYNDKTFDINVAVGVVSITQETTDLGDLVSSASAACHQAQGRGNNRIASYDKKDSEIMERRTEVLLATELMNSIKHGRTRLFQQRIQSLGGKDSFEILLRIKDKENGFLPPGQFLNAAERYSLTPNLDRWVVKEALQWAGENPQAIDSLNYLSINLSGLSICDESFTDHITDCFKEFEVPPEKICFEITETAAISNFIRAGEFISAIKDLGCKFALDDFGSGMSSFAYLKNLPVDILKIDGMFVKDIVNSPVDMAMVKAINEVGHVMGLKTVAEYVENRAILEMLSVIEVDAFQGYEIAKPAPIDELKILLNHKKFG